MFEFATCSWVMFKSSLIVAVNYRVFVSFSSSSIPDIETYQRRKCIPREECNHKAQPREGKNTAILVERVQNGNRQGFPVTGVDLRRNKKQFDIVHCPRSLHSFC